MPDLKTMEGFREGRWKRSRKEGRDSDSLGSTEKRMYHLKFKKCEVHTNVSSKLLSKLGVLVEQRQTLVHPFFNYM